MWCTLNNFDPPQSPEISSSQFQYFPLSQVSPGLCFPSFTPFLAPAFVPAYGICSLEPGLSGQVINMDIFRFSSTVETCTRGQTQAKIWADPTRNQERERTLVRLSYCFSYVAPRPWWITSLNPQRLNPQHELASLYPIIIGDWGVGDWGGLWYPISWIPNQGMQRVQCYSSNLMVDFKNIQQSGAITPNLLSMDVRFIWNRQSLPAYGTNAMLQSDFLTLTLSMHCIYNIYNMVYLIGTIQITKLI